MRGGGFFGGKPFLSGERKSFPPNPLSEGKPLYHYAVRPSQRGAGGVAAFPMKNAGRSPAKRLSSEGGRGTGGERGQWPIQRTGGAARNEQATGREHATIECREPFFLQKEGFPPQKPSPVPRTQYTEIPTSSTRSLAIVIRSFSASVRTGFPPSAISMICLWPIVVPYFSPLQ